jgi:hypothetical protein
MGRGGGLERLPTMAVSDITLPDMAIGLYLPEGGDLKLLSRAFS